MSLELEKEGMVAYEKMGIEDFPHATDRDIWVKGYVAAKLEDLKNIGFGVKVFESEKGWGSKLDDHMVCLTSEDSLRYKNEFNNLNDDKVTPDYYMYAEGEPVEISLTEQQYDVLLKDSRVWLSSLKKM